MFKKLKDKIAEEVRQAPLRLPASVQHQLSQYSAFTQDTSTTKEEITQVVNPDDKRVTGANTEKLVDITEENSMEENGMNRFSIDDENNSPSLSPWKSNELRGAGKEDLPIDQSMHGPMTISRQPSMSSVFSDIAFTGAGDSSYHPYQFQSDLESNVSEFDECASGQYSFGRLTKDQIYYAYQKTRARYQKYKGRYTDLAKYYKDLEREREKIKNILVDTQDRSMRRISELKEQCLLEQQAKAHLEEILRSDLEEKDNHIAVLQTKVKLLKSGIPSTVSEPVVESNSSSGQQDNATYDNQDANEIQTLQEKLQRFESLLLKCKEKIRTQKEQIGKLEADHEMAIKSLGDKEEEIRQLHLLPKEELTHLTESLDMARKEIETLRQQEQDVALAAAENKQQVHEELLRQEDEVLKLRAEREQLTNKVAMLESELVSLKDHVETTSRETELLIEEEKRKMNLELSSEKMTALKSLEEETCRKLAELKCEHESILKDKLTELNESHVRATRVLESDYQMRLTELEKEKHLALEEKELYFASQLNQERNNYQTSLEEMNLLKSRLDEMLAVADKTKEDLLAERRSWIQQIEDNRQRHKEEINQLNAQHEQAIQNEIRQHRNDKESSILNLKDKHRLEIEAIQRCHEELVQALNEDLEMSKCVQIDQMRNLITEKELELGKCTSVISRHEVEGAEQSAKIAALENRVCELSSSLEAFQNEKEAELVEVRSVSSRLEAECSAKDAKIADLEKEIGSYVEASGSLQAQYSAKEDEMNALQACLAEKKEELTRLHSLLSQAEAESSIKDTKIADLENESGSLQVESSAKEAKMNALQTCLVEKEAELTKLHSVLSQAEAESSVKDTKIADLEREMANSLKIVENESDKHSIERDLSSMTDKCKQLEEQCLESQQLLQANAVNEAQVIQLTNELSENQQQLLKLNEELKIVRDTHANQLAQVTLQLENSEARVRSKEVELESCTRTFQSITEESVDKLGQLQEQLKTSLERFVVKQLEVEELQNNARSADEKIKELSLQVEELTSSLQRNQVKLTGAVNEVEIMTAAMAEMRGFLSEKERQLLGKNSQLELLVAQIEQVHARLSRTKTELQSSVDIVSAFQPDQFPSSDNGAEMDGQQTQQQVQTGDGEGQVLLSQVNAMLGQVELFSSRHLKLENAHRSFEEMQQQNNQLKLDLEAMMEEGRTLRDEKNRQDVLCRRLKAQLSDVTKLMRENQDNLNRSDFSEQPVSARSVSTLSSTSAEHSPTKQMPLEVSGEVGQVPFDSDFKISEALRQVDELRKELAVVHDKHKTEVLELNHLLDIAKKSSSANASLEEATELEYLRNILLEYMMGQQPTTLAKVLAAVVKFTPEQTKKIIEREEQRQSLLGHLGFI